MVVVRFLITPGKAHIAEAPTRGMFPFRFSRQATTGPDCECLCIVPGYMDNRMVGMPVVF